MLVARRALSRGGATVVKVVAGTMLVEVEPTLVAELAKGLPGWRYTVERKSTRIPERK